MDASHAAKTLAKPSTWRPHFSVCTQTQDNPDPFVHEIRNRTYCILRFILRAQFRTNTSIEMVVIYGITEMALGPPIPSHRFISELLVRLPLRASTLGTRPIKSPKAHNGSRWTHPYRKYPSPGCSCRRATAV